MSELTLNGLPARFSIGGRGYHIHPIVQYEDGEEIYWSDVRTLGLEIGACMGDEDGIHIYGHYRELPRKYSGGFAYSKHESGIIYHQEIPIDSSDWKDVYGNDIRINPGAVLAFPYWADGNGNIMVLGAQSKWWNQFPKSPKEPVYGLHPRKKVRGYSYIHLVSREN